MKSAIPFRLEIPSGISEAVDSGKKLEVPERICFRKEDWGRSPELNYISMIKFKYIRGDLW